MECKHCNETFTNENEYMFHRRVDCKIKIDITPRYITETRCIIPKKYLPCYRCGRLGHYYGKRECFATKDVDGNEIKWGEARPTKNSKKITGTYSSVHGSNR